MSRKAELLFLIGLAGCGSGEEPANPPAEEPAHAFRGITVYERPPAADFALEDQHGRPFRLRDARGRIVLLFFGYVHCPDVCPTTLSTWVGVERELGEASKDVAFVFVSVDPERDTPERLGKHLAAFSSDFIGLGGNPAELDPVYEAYDVHREEVPISESAAGYLVDHTTRMFLIDGRGRLRAKYDFRTSAHDIAGDIRWLLEQGGRG